MTGVTQVLGHQLNSGHNPKSRGEIQFGVSEVCGIIKWWVGASQSVVVETRFEVFCFLGTGVWAWFCGTKVSEFWVFVGLLKQIGFCGVVGFVGGSESVSVLFQLVFVETS